MSLNVVGSKNESATEPSGPVVTLTELTVRMVKESMKAEGRTGEFLRIGVVGGGCSGFNYLLDFEAEAKEEDIQFEVDGLRVLVDSMSAPLLKGVQVDYVTQGLQSGFKFVNPNANKTCGCGTSFSV